MHGADNSSNADAYVNTLALRGCSIIIATGPLPIHAVTDRAPSYPKLTFLIVGTTTSTTTTPAPHANNVNQIPADTPHAIETAVANALVADYRKATGSHAR